MRVSARGFGCTSAQTPALISSRGKLFPGIEGKHQHTVLAIFRAFPDLPSQVQAQTAFAVFPGLDPVELKDRQETSVNDTHNAAGCGFVSGLLVPPCLVSRCGDHPRPHGRLQAVHRITPHPPDLVDLAPPSFVDLGVTDEKPIVFLVIFAAVQWVGRCLKPPQVRRQPAFFIGEPHRQWREDVVQKIGDQANQRTGQPDQKGKDKSPSVSPFNWRNSSRNGSASASSSASFW